MKRRRPVVTPTAYVTITVVALVALGFIIVTGAAVRLTGSGLGCSDWPTCEQDKFVPPLETHALVEYINRMITGLVSAAVILAVLGAKFRQPYRRDLAWLAGGLVGGVIAQIVLGGITVLTDLHPAAVQAHLILSMLIVWDAVVLNHRAGQPKGPRVTRTSTTVARLSRAVVVLTGVAIVAGTVVTGSGPHGGDEDVRRFGFDISNVARIHGITVMVLLGVTLVLLYFVWRHGAPKATAQAGELFILVGVMQAAVGYIQYFTDVPVLLVGAHVLGSVLVWTAALRLELSTRGPLLEDGGVLAGFDGALLEVDHLDEDAVERERVP